MQICISITTVRRLIFAALCGLALLLSVPALGDRLILDSGEVIETRGPWEVKDHQVLFLNTRGQYSSIHVSEVNLDASRKPSAASRPPGQATHDRQTKKAAVLILRDGDVARFEADVAEDDALLPVGRYVRSSDSFENRPAWQVDNGLLLEVTDWRSLPAGENEAGALLKGRLQNSSRQSIIGVSLVVTLTDREGKRVGEEPATLSTRALPPHGQAMFEAKFPTAWSFSRVDFAVDGQPLLTRTEADSSTETRR